MNRTRAGVTALAVLALVSCGRTEKTEDLVRRALERTERQSRDFIYSEQATDRKIEVRGVVQDMFRSRSSVTINGKPAAEVIDFDDARAVRALQRSAVPGSLGPGWVIDEQGAPDPLRAQPTGIAQDPIRDAATIFDYARAAVTSAESVATFNPEAIEYRAEEDPFPRPDEATEEVRYDLVLPDIPQRSIRGANEAVPDVQHFRKMAFYVRAGVVVRMLESIDVGSRLTDLERVYDTKFDRTKTREENAEIAVGAVNALRQGQGTQPIRPRALSYEATNIGTPRSVELPRGALRGSVAFLAALVSPTTSGLPGAPGLPSVIGAPGLATAPQEGTSPGFSLVRPPTQVAPTEPISSVRPILWMLGVPLALAAMLAVLLRGRVPAVLRMGR